MPSRITDFRRKWSNTSDLSCLHQFMIRGELSSVRPMRKKAGGFNMKIVLRILFLYEFVFVHSRALVLFGWAMYARMPFSFSKRTSQDRIIIFTSNAHVAYILYVFSNKMNTECIILLCQSSYVESIPLPSDWCECIA